MTDSQKHLQDLSEIRTIMERSTRFLSLSGMAGISAGIIALLGTIAAYLHLGSLSIPEGMGLDPSNGDTSLSTPLFLLADAAIVLLLGLASAIFFSWRKANMQGEPIWTPVTRKLVFHLLIPLVTGGLLVFMAILQQDLNMVIPATLLWYGIALVNAGKYTNREIIWLGMIEIGIGLAAIQWPQIALLFWGIGFGVLHIIYGTALYMKYDRKVA